MRPALIFFGVALALPVQAATPASIGGRWVNEYNVAVVEFTPCGTKMCGHIQRFLIAEPKGGVRDGKNPDKSKRTRKLLGARVFWDMSAHGSVWKGQGYMPEEGRTFKANLSVEGGKMKVKGCVAIFCRTVYWKQEK